MLLNTLKAQHHAILALSRQYGARHIRVFGSVARGEDRPDSDIDFLVEFPPATTCSRSACRSPMIWLICLVDESTLCRSMSSVRTSAIGCCEKPSSYDEAVTTRPKTEPSAALNRIRESRASLPAGSCGCFVAPGLDRRLNTDLACRVAGNPSRFALG